MTEVLSRNPFLYPKPRLLKGHSAVPWKRSRPRVQLVAARSRKHPIARTRGSSPCALARTGGSQVSTM